MDFFLVYTVVWFVGTFVFLGLVLFAEYTKLDELESYFSENEKVRRHKRFLEKKSANRPVSSHGVDGRHSVDAQGLPESRPCD